MKVLHSLPTALVVAAIAWASVPAVAHHSPAVFDRTKRVTISGTVETFRWGNPHSWIHLSVAAENGVERSWTVEMNPASLLSRGGWRSSSLKPGDQVTVTVHPLRNDEAGGQFISIVLPDGRILGEVPAELGSSPSGE